MGEPLRLIQDPEEGYFAESDLEQAEFDYYKLIKKMHEKKKEMKIRVDASGKFISNKRLTKLG